MPYVVSDCLCEGSWKLQESRTDLSWRLLFNFNLPAGRILQQNNWLFKIRTGKNNKNSEETGGKQHSLRRSKRMMIPPEMNLCKLSGAQKKRPKADAGLLTVRYRVCVGTHSKNGSGRIRALLTGLSVRKHCFTSFANVSRLPTQKNMETPKWNQWKLNKLIRG